MRCVYVHLLMKTHIHVVFADAKDLFTYEDTHSIH